MNLAVKTAAAFFFLRQITAAQMLKTALLCHMAEANRPQGKIQYQLNCDCMELGVTYHLSHTLESLRL